MEIEEAMTPDSIKELVVKLRDTIMTDRGFGQSDEELVNPDGPEAANALEAMAGEVERLKREAEVHEDETVAMTGGMYADMKIKAQLTAERDCLKAALVEAVAMLRPLYEDDYLQSKFSKALGGDA